MKIAHLREVDQKAQSVQNHLTGVAMLCEKFTAKVGLQGVGELLGLLHDFGKYSDSFQCYIQSATGILTEGVDDNFVDVKKKKGKIDHSTAGAQWIWQQFNGYGVQGRLVAQILAVALASHHGGMLDCLKPNGEYL